MTLFALPTLLTASTMLALGLMVLIRERHSRVGVSFFVMTLTGAIWLFSYSLVYCARTEGAALAWSVIGHIGIIFIPPGGLSLRSKAKFWTKSPTMPASCFS